MGANSAIEWTDHTFNPWTGCQRVSPGCDHCYAEALSKRAPRTFGSWLPGGPRKRTSEEYWKQPLRWNRKAEKEGVRRRVFCASMADVFDNQASADWREDLWALIHDTPNLDWLLLTKRPQNIMKMLPGSEGRGDIPHSRAVWGDGWPNVWLGTSAENQEEADRRIPRLLRAPAAKHFLSCEPLLGPLRLDQCGLPVTHHGALDALRGESWIEEWWDEAGEDRRRKVVRTWPGKIDWCIAGGESGPKARPMHPAWARSLRDQCQAASVPFFMKQMGGPVKASMPAIPPELQRLEVPHV